MLLTILCLIPLDDGRTLERLADCLRGGWLNTRECFHYSRSRISFWARLGLAWPLERFMT